MQGPKNVIDRNEPVVDLDHRSRHELPSSSRQGGVVRAVPIQRYFVGQIDRVGVIRLGRGGVLVIGQFRQVDRLRLIVGVRILSHFRQEGNLVIEGVADRPVSFVHGLCHGGGLVGRRGRIPQSFVKQVANRVRAGWIAGELRVRLRQNLWAVQPHFAGQLPGVAVDQRRVRPIRQVDGVDLWRRFGNIFGAFGRHVGWRGHRHLAFSPLQPEPGWRRPIRRRTPRRPNQRQRHENNQGVSRQKSSHVSLAIAGGAHIIPVSPLAAIASAGCGSGSVFRANSGATANGPYARPEGGPCPPGLRTPFRRA